MKKIFALFLIVFLTSCSLGDEDTNFAFVRLGVESAEVPESVTVNTPLQISLTFLRPSTCHFVEGFEPLGEDLANNTFTFALVASFIEQSTCQDLVAEESQALFDFIPSTTGLLTFRFWQGVDENGEDEFLTLELLVEENE